MEGFASGMVAPLLFWLACYTTAVCWGGPCISKCEGDAAMADSQLVGQLCLSSPTPQLGNLSLRGPGCLSNFWPKDLISPPTCHLPPQSPSLVWQHEGGPPHPARPSMASTSLPLFPSFKQEAPLLSALPFLHAFSEPTLAGGGLDAVLPGMIMSINF